MKIFPDDVLHKSREKPVKKHKPFYIFKFYWEASDTLEGNLTYRLFPYDPREVYGEDMSDLIDEVLGGPYYHELVHSTHAEYVPRPSKAILKDLLDDVECSVKDIQRNLKVKKELIAAITERLNKE